jgi:hypothetical protein
MVTISRFCICTGGFRCAILTMLGRERRTEMNLSSRSNKVELLLHPHQLISLDNVQHKMAIECKNGVIWVTCSGEHQDYILRAGRFYVPKTKGTVVIEAVDDACVDIEER